MAEVVGTVAAVLELTKTTASTALQVYEFFSVIHDAPREINTLSQDVHAFYSLVQNLAVSLETVSVRSVVENDDEVESSLKTLVKPMGNCCTALRRMKDKLGPYVKSEVSSVQGSRQESGSSQPSIERLRMKSGGNITWFFRRREVLASAMELERTKATLGDAMGSVTLFLTFKRTVIETGARDMARHHDFNDNVGLALSDYAVSVYESQPSGTLVPGSSASSTLGTESSRKSPFDPRLAEELKNIIRSNSKFVVEAVLQKVDVDVRDGGGRTALSHASEKGDVDMMRLLIEEGASISARQYSLSTAHHSSGITPLHWAARNGHTDAVGLLLRHGANPNARGTAGRAAIQEACARNHIDVVRVLLSKGADVNAQSSYDGWTCVHEAVFAKHIYMLRILIESGALLNLQLIYPDDKAPLHFAVALKSLEMTTMLLEGGADSNILMVKNISPLHLAAAGGWTQGIDLLLSFGADINAADMFTQETPLHKAARNIRKAAIDKLREQGANEEVENCDGQTYGEILVCAESNPKQWKVHDSRAAYLRQQNDAPRP